MVMIKQLTITALILIIAGIGVWAWGYHVGYCSSQATEVDQAKSANPTIIFVSADCIK